MILKIPKTLSAGEEAFAQHLATYKIKMQREYKFHPERLWRFDFAYPEKKIAIEIEGGTKRKGRHTTHNGFSADIEKYNAAAMLGWKVFRFTTEMVIKGIAIDQTRKIFEFHVANNEEGNPS